jgi:hypothetical protein
MASHIDEGIFARMTGFHELRLNVAPHYQLSCVSVDVNGLGTTATLFWHRATRSSSRTA